MAVHAFSLPLPSLVQFHLSQICVFRRLVFLLGVLLLEPSQISPFYALHISRRRKKTSFKKPLQEFAPSSDLYEGQAEVYRANKDSKTPRTNRQLRRSIHIWVQICTRKQFWQEAKTVHWRKKYRWFQFASSYSFYVCFGINFFLTSLLLKKN